MRCQRTCTVLGCERPYEARGFCEAHYKRWQRNPTAPDLTLIDQSEEEFFWSHVSKTDTCWLWIGQPTYRGYGRFIYKGRETPAHRKALELVNGPIPADYEACHNCPDGDNKLCVNPAHLRVQTHQEHTAETMAKGQLPSGRRNGKYTKPERTPRGERHPNHRLTEEAVREIRRQRAEGRTVQSLAITFGVTKRSILNVLQGRLWRHVL